MELHPCGPHRDAGLPASALVVSEGFTRVYHLAEKVEFVGTALEKRKELQTGADEPAPAELSTVETTVASGLRHSLKAISEAMHLIRTSEAWNDWSPYERELRNKRAGQKKSGL